MELSLGAGQVDPVADRAVFVAGINYLISDGSSPTEEGFRAIPKLIKLSPLFLFSFTCGLHVSSSNKVFLHRLHISVIFCLLTSIEENMLVEPLVLDPPTATETKIP